MNNLLNSISWTIYFDTITLLTVVYYALIGWTYYRAEIKAFIARLNGNNGADRELPQVLKYADSPEEISAITGYSQPEEIAGYQLHTGAAQELRQSLTACITLAGRESYAPNTLIPKLKKILNDYPEVAATPEREEINALIVRECEKTGTALLSESEVDLWWSA